MKPLTDASRGKGGRNTKLPWDEKKQAAFVAAKKELAEAAVLAHPSSGAEVALAVDACEHHMGGVLQQRTDKKEWQPLAFFSRKLSVTETSYSTYDR